jgi:hippurate hydrolase
VTARVAGAFAEHFGDRAETVSRESASEDFSDIPSAFGAPYTYWALGGIDAGTWEKATASEEGRSSIPANHSPQFAPAIQPTLDTGTSAIVVAALAWLAP